MARQLGIRLMAWQEQVLEVATELLADGTFAYREIIVTVPRQNGKTTLLLVKEIHRAILWAARAHRPQRLVYTAQTGRDGVKKVLEDQVPIILASPFAAVIDSVRKVNGSEGLVFVGGSRLDVLASSESAGHGRTVDEGYIDEAFDDVDDRREQAILPAMSTRPDGQLWVVSTQGTDASLYLNRKIDAGREAILHPSEIAYFEWSADETLPVGDVATWRSCMPAWGVTVRERAIRHAYETMTEGEFRRAFLNQRTASDERVIPQDVWDQVCSPSVIPEGRVVFAFDCNPERSSGSVAVADQDGNIELMPDADRGTGWIVPRVLQLTTKWNAPAAVDPAGPAGAFIPELESAGVEIIPLGSGEFVKACGVFYDAVLQQQMQVLKDGRLDAALAAAKKRPVGDAWAWTRKSSTADISPIVAATVAYFAARKDDGEVTFWNLADI